MGDNLRVYLFIYFILVLRPVILICVLAVRELTWLCGMWLVLQVVDRCFVAGVKAVRGIKPPSSVVIVVHELVLLTPTCW